LPADWGYVDMDTRQLIIDTAERIFADHCEKSLLDAAEQGTFPQDLWGKIVENGFHQLGSTGSGTEPADLYAFLRCVAGFQCHCLWLKYYCLTNGLAMLVMNQA
jgi:hypothetical protein